MTSSVQSSINLGNAVKSRFSTWQCLKKTIISMIWVRLGHSSSHMCLKMNCCCFTILLRNVLSYEWCIHILYKYIYYICIYAYNIEEGLSHCIHNCLVSNEWLEWLKSWESWSKEIRQEKYEWHRKFMCIFVSHVNAYGRSFTAQKFTSQGD